MAIFLADGDVIEVRVVTNILEQIGVNRRYYQIEQSFGLGGTTQQFADEIDTQVQAEYKAIMPATAAYRGVSVQRVFPGPRTVAAVSIANAGNGFALGQLLPPQVSALIATRTDSAGRAFRGRVYVPWPSDDFNDPDAKPSAVFVAGQLNALAVKLLTDIIVGDPTDNAVAVTVLFRPPSGPITPIVQMLPRTEWATQRRRGGFGAKNVLPF